jgi:chromosome segregation ATPase
LASEHSTGPSIKLRTVSRTRDHKPRPEDSWSPALRVAESPELQALVQERDQLREQLRHVKDLSSRLIDKVDEQAHQIELLEATVKGKEALIRGLEAEAAQLIANASTREQHVNVLKGEFKELESANDELVSKAVQREERMAQLESFLEMIAQAESRDK